jgi:hypothetical protein
MVSVPGCIRVLLSVAYWDHQGDGCTRSDSTNGIAQAGQQPRLDSTGGVVQHARGDGGVRRSHGDGSNHPQDCGRVSTELELPPLSARLTDTWQPMASVPEWLTAAVCSGVECFMRDAALCSADCSMHPLGAHHAAAVQPQVPPHRPPAVVLLELDGVAYQLAADSSDDAAPWVLNPLLLGVCEPHTAAAGQGQLQHPAGADTLRHVDGARYTAAAAAATAEPPPGLGAGGPALESACRQRMHSGDSTAADHDSAPVLQLQAHSGGVDLDYRGDNPLKCSLLAVQQSPEAHISVAPCEPAVQHTAQCSTPPSAVSAVVVTGASDVSAPEAVAEAVGQLTRHMCTELADSGRCEFQDTVMPFEPCQWHSTGHDLTQQSRCCQLVSSYLRGHEWLQQCQQQQCEEQQQQHEEEEQKEEEPQLHEQQHEQTITPTSTTAAPTMQQPEDMTVSGPAHLDAEQQQEQQQHAVVLQAATAHASTVHGPLPLGASSMFSGHTPVRAQVTGVLGDASADAHTSSHRRSGLLAHLCICPARCFAPRLPCTRVDVAPA